MLHLSALALGPLLARAAPKIGSGNVDNSTTISKWLTERFFDPDGKFAKVLTRTADRAWRSLEIALAGEDLHQKTIEAGVDRALVEQIRQYISVVNFPEIAPGLRQKLLQDIHKARQSEGIPGPIPTPHALAASVVRYLGVTDESVEIDNSELAELGLELRIAGFSTLSGFIEQRSTDRPPLLITAVRYFFAREITEDLSLLRDLRYTRFEMMTDALRTGFDRLADAFDRFNNVLIDLLSQLALSAAKSEEETRLPGPESTKLEEPGFAIIGEHLIAPIRVGTDGSRFAPCPVCLTHADLKKTARSWVSLRCNSCGTEFQATDGTTPPPPPPPALKLDLTPRSKTPTQLARNLQLWIDSGYPLRWIERHRGNWNDLDFRTLIEILRTTQYWPLELSDVRRVLTDLTMQIRSGVPKRSSSPPAASSPVSKELGRGLVRTSDHYSTIDGTRWVPCPICRSFNVEVPVGTSGEVRLTCSGCLRQFLVDLGRKPRVSPSPIPPPASSTLWGKIRKWFGS